MIAGARRVIDHDPDTVEFVVWAPDHDHVELSLDAVRYAMTPAPGGYHHVRVGGVARDARYGYVLPDGRTLADPASRAQPDGVHGLSAIVDDQFLWTDDAWQAPHASDFVICEIHIGTFTHDGTFAAAALDLPRLAAAGYNAVEVMPIAEFPGARNWGYDGVFPYAAQSTYGGADGFRAFVDAAHAHGLAVILDVVYNHLGPEGAILGAFGPYFTGAYRTPWGDAMNFSEAGSDAVREYFIENAWWWCHGCHVDGLRLDAVHAIVDPTALPFTELLVSTIHERAALAGRTVSLIAESDANDPRLVVSPERHGIGFDAAWNDDFHHALHTLVTGEHDGYYAGYARVDDLARSYRDSYVFEGQYDPNRKRRHGRPVGSIPHDAFVTFAQNHDQIGNRARGDRLSTQRPDALHALAAAVLLGPNIPLRFMGEEYGETAPFPYFVSHTDPDLVEAVRQGRAREFAQVAGATPADPAAPETFAAARLERSLLDRPWHLGLLTWQQDLVRARRTVPALMHRTRESVSAVSYDDERVTVVERRGPDGSAALLVLHFGPDDVECEAPAGTWSSRLDSVEYAGTGGVTCIDGTLHCGPWAAALFEGESP